MKKWTLFTAAIVVSGGLLAWNAGWLPMQKSNKNLAYIPADTVYYFGGTSVEEVAEFAKDYPMMPTSPSQSKMWDTLLESATSDGESSPQLRFFTHLMNEFNNLSEGTMGQLAEFTGLALTGSFALFSDGIMPVIRMDVANEDAFNAVIENAVQDSEWQYEWADLGAFKARMWKLNDDMDAVYLAVSNHEGNVVITIVTSKDDLEAKQRRFGIIKPEESLATNSTIKDLKNRYNYNENMIGFIQFNQIAQAILSPESNSLGRDLAVYLPEGKLTQVQDSLTTECKIEYGELADSIPRLVMGYQSLDVNDSGIEFDMHSAFELTNTNVVTELQKVQGHLPLHSTMSSDKVFAFGLGVNADNIGPVATALLTQFTDAEFNCRELQMVQDAAREQNPAMLGMMTAMAQGVQGIGISLFDITMSEDDFNPMPGNIDVIASIATENPTTLLNMAKMLPFFATLNLSDDGTPVLLDLPMLPPNLEVKAAIKGNHLVVFSGEQATKAANEQANESIEANGLMSMAFNYRKIGDLITSKTFNSLSSSMGGVDACMQQYEMAHLFQSLKMDISMVTSVENDGIVTKYKGSMDKPVMTTAQIPGKYRVEYMNEYCEWEGSTIDELKTDGTGYYEGKDENNVCNLYEYNYSWVKKGNTLELSGDEQNREACDMEFPEATQETFTCHLMNVKADSFQCLFQPGTDYPTLSRYTRM